VRSHAEMTIKVKTAATTVYFQLIFDIFEMKTKGNFYSRRNDLETILISMTKLTPKGLQYEAKVLVAWGECIDGNQKITEWFMKNGFPELALFRYALRNEDRSRDWLLANGFPHLMALINGIEGNKNALTWLKTNNFNLLHLMAMAGDGDEDAFQKLMTPETKVFALLAKKMEHIKDEIEMDNNDIHKISST